MLKTNVDLQTRLRKVRADISEILGDPTKRWLLLYGPVDDTLVDELIQMVAADEPDTRKINLFIVSGGGTINSARKLIHVLQALFPHVEVFVPAAALSAATLISVSFQGLTMSALSTLSPLDPQLASNGASAGDSQLSSEDIKALKHVGEEWFGLSETNNRFWLDSLTRVISPISIALLYRYEAMIIDELRKNLSRNNVGAELINSTIALFTSRIFSHTYPIFAADLQQIQFPVKTLDLHNGLALYQIARSIKEIIGMLEHESKISTTCVLMSKTSCHVKSVSFVERNGSPNVPQITWTCITEQG